MICQQCGAEVVATVPPEQTQSDSVAAFTKEVIKLSSLLHVLALLLVTILLSVLAPWQDDVGWALTRTGIIVAWVPLWAGIVLYQSASRLKRAHGSESKEQLILSLGKLRSYFKIMAIGLVVAILLVPPMVVMYGVLHAREAGNEATAVAYLRRISVAQSAYRADAGHYGSITDLVRYNRKLWIGSVKKAAYPFA